MEKTNRHRSSLGSPPPEDGSAADETNYALIWWSGSGRHKRSWSYSSNSSSTSSSSPLWSPRRSGGAPPAGVPFSWEARPGVPKQKPDAGGDTRELRRLPLADPNLSARRRRAAKTRSDDDPFVTALVECMKDSRVGRRRTSSGSSYSCMRACSTVDSLVAVPRARVDTQSLDRSKESKKHNAEKASLLYSRSSNNSCRSENATTEVVCPGKILRHQQTSWNVEFCRSVLHR